ncbi:uncharacterized protein METZ01_LOCUS448190, partial [marine metagenome]
TRMGMEIWEGTFRIDGATRNPQNHQTDPQKKQL